MLKLTSLRENLLTSPLGIKAAKLVTWAESGTLTSTGAGQGRDNRNFTAAYDAHALVMGFAGNPLDLFFRVLDWLEEICPGTDSSVISFNVDAPNSKSADVEIIVKLTETASATATPGGLRLEAKPDPQPEDAELAALMGNQGG